MLEEPATGGDPTGPQQIAVVTMLTGAGLAMVTQRKHSSFFRQLRRLRASG